MVAKASFRGRIYETIHQYERHWTVTFRYGASFMRHALVAALLATSMFSLPTTAHAQAMSAEEAAALRAELAALRAKVETLEARIDQASPPTVSAATPAPPTATEGKWKGAPESSTERGRGFKPSAEEGGGGKEGGRKG